MYFQAYGKMEVMCRLSELVWWLRMYFQEFGKMKFMCRLSQGNNIWVYLDVAKIIIFSIEHDHFSGADDHFSEAANSNMLGTNVEVIIYQVCLVY